MRWLMLFYFFGAIASLLMVVGVILAIGYFPPAIPLVIGGYLLGMYFVARWSRRLL